MGAYAICRNNNLPFVNGAISASIKTMQPQLIDAHEAFYSLRLYDIYSLSGGVFEDLRQIFCGSHTHSYPNKLAVPIGTLF